MRIRIAVRTRDGLGLLLALVLTTAPQLSARQMTVSQLQKFISYAKAAHRDDDFVLKKLAGVKLTERLNAATLDELIAATPGPKTALAVHFIGDASAFLDPPASEIPSLPAPGIDQQKAMIRQSIHYVAHTLHSLPNFTATRVTRQLVDSPQGLETEQTSLLGAVYLVNTFRAPIALRDGQETEEPAVVDGRKVTSTRFDTPRDAIVRIPAGPAIGLTAHGEFGPILATVILDVSKGKMTWARWEKIDGKPVAVFQFSVDQSVSHFSVDFAQSAHAEVVDDRPPPSLAPVSTERPLPTGPSRTLGAIPVDSEHTVKKELAYHGNLAMDPESGAILRITIMAARLPEDPLKRAEMMVEYGPVQIGDQTYICPTHSVALSTSAEPNQLIANSSQTMTEVHLNEAEFVGYHRFGSESTLIMASAPAAGRPGPTPSSAVETAAASTSAIPPDAATTSPIPESNGVSGSVDPAPVDKTAAATPPPAVPVDAPPATSGPALASGPAVAPAPAVSVAEAEADEEILVRAVDGLPGGAADSGNTTANGGATSNPVSPNFTLKVATRLVDLSLVAADKHGKPIPDLRQDEIEVYDNGHKQQLVDFRHANFGGNVSGGQQLSVANQPANTFTNAAPAAVRSPDAPDLLVFLMDEGHLAVSDLIRARGEVLHFLKAVPTASQPPFRIAIYSIGWHGLRIIQDVTQDHALASSTLAAWAPSTTEGQGSRQSNREHFDAVHSTTDLEKVKDTSTDAPGSLQAVDPELRSLGANPMRGALEGMIALSRHLAPIPGHKSLIWISGDRVLTGIEGQAASMDKGSEILQAALLHTCEVINEAHIALYAVNVSSVQGSSENVARDSREQINPGDTGGGGASGSHTAPPEGSGRARSEAPQSESTILAPVRQLTDLTGGRVVDKGGDLERVLQGIHQDSAFIYELGFEPDTAADGKFHTLQVRIPNRKDVKLRYRIGYLFEQDSATPEQRFQQAIWSPQDATGIALTAETVPRAASDSASGRSIVNLHIALPGLALEQHAGRWTGQLYVYVAQRDDAALKTDVFGDTVHISLKPATYASGMPAGIPYHCQIDPKSSLGSIRIIVIDGKSGQMGSITLPSSSLAPKG